MTGLVEARISWPAPNGLPSLAAGMVHVWAWSLNRVHPEHAQMLSEAETTRAAKLVFPEHRGRFLAAHAGMRRILGRYLHCDPASLTFKAGEYGKPSIGDAAADLSKLRFNLSHSRELALLAVSDGIEVGVDVEFIRPVTEGIAERFFTAPEIAALTAAPAKERLRHFYALWTSKEAFLKGIGSGISGGLNSFSASLCSDGAQTLSDSGTGITAGWTLAQLEPATGYIGAVAAKTQRLAIQCFRHAT